MTAVLIKGGHLDTDMHTGKMEVEIKVKPTIARKPPATRREAWNGFSLHQPSGGANSADTLILNFCPPEL